MFRHINPDPARRRASYFPIFRILALSCCAMGGACTESDTTIARVGGALDEVVAKVESYGTITISAPVLAAPGPSFQFNFTKGGADNYYTDAQSNVQGVSATLNQRGQSFSGGASVQLDPTLITAFLAQQAQFTQAQQQFLAFQKAHPPTAAPTAPTPPTDTSSTLPTAPTGLALQPTDVTALLVNSNKFANPLALVPASAPNPALSDRSAIITAAGDRATEAIFTVLGDPTLASQFKDKKVLFGVSMVSVNPGWLTRNGYEAHLGVVSSYHYKPARLDVLTRFLADTTVPLALRKRVAIDEGVAPPGGDQGALPSGAPIPVRYEPLVEGPNLYPNVSAVSPMTETQALDLSSSDRNQDQTAINLAFALRYAGLGAQAQAFEEFVKNRQQDTRTRTPSVSINAYSHNGGLFGFEVGPRLTAIEDPARQRADGPANVLDRQSFPILIIFGLETEEIRPRVKVEGHRYHLIEPILQLDSYTNWIPLDPRRPRLSEKQQMQLAYDLREATDKPYGPQSDSLLTEDDLATFKALKDNDYISGTESSAKLEKLKKDLRDSVKPPPHHLLAFGNAQTQHPPDISDLIDAIDDLQGTERNLRDKSLSDRARLDEQLNAIEQDRTTQLKARQQKLISDLAALTTALTAASTANDKIVVASRSASAKLEAAKATVAEKTNEAAQQQKAFDTINAAKDPIIAALKKNDPAAYDTLLKAAKTDLDKKNDAVIAAQKPVPAASLAVSSLAAQLKASTASLTTLKQNTTTQQNALEQTYAIDVNATNKVAADLTTRVLSGQTTDLDTATGTFNAALKKAARFAADPEIQKWIESKIVHHNDALVKAVGLASDRANVLRYRMFGSDNTNFIPEDYVQPPDPTASAAKVTAVYPSSIILQRGSDGNPIPQTVPVVIVGTNLKNVDTTAASYTDPKHPRIHGGASFASTTQPVSASQDVLVAQLNVTSAQGVILELPLQGSSDTIYALPISVTAATPPPVQIQRLQTPGFKWFGGIDQLKFTPSAPPDVVKAEIDREKLHHEPNGPVNVQIEAASQPGQPKH